jgi:hypothetical protein
MPIEGPVHELALTDLLQLLHLSRKTGRLSVRDGAGQSPVTLDLHEGALIGADRGVASSRLGRLLFLAGRASAAEVRAALEEQRARPGRRLGSILVEQGAVTRADVERQLRFQVEETVFDVVRLQSGHFRFEEARPADPGPIPLRMPTDAVLMDAVRRMDEWMEVTSTASEADPVPLLAPAAPGPALDLAPLEWEVLGEVDGERTTRAIAQALGRGELEVARALRSLAAAGVVTMATVAR